MNVFVVRLTRKSLTSNSCFVPINYLERRPETSFIYPQPRSPSSSTRITHNVYSALPDYIDIAVHSHPASSISIQWQNRKFHADGSKPSDRPVNYQAYMHHIHIMNIMRIMLAANLPPSLNRFQSHSTYFCISVNQLSNAKNIYSTLMKRKPASFDTHSPRRFDTIIPGVYHSYVPLLSLENISAPAHPWSGVCLIASIQQPTGLLVKGRKRAHACP